MTLLTSGYHCHGSPYIIAAPPHPRHRLREPMGRRPPSKQSPAVLEWPRVEGRMLNVPLHLLIDTKPLVYRRHGDLHLFIVAPPSPLPPHLCSLSSACTPPLHSHNPPRLWRRCMKWILPHPAAMILISPLPLLPSSFLSPLFIARCIDSTSPSEPAS